MIDDNQLQILLGTLLGNGYICNGKKNPYFCMRHSKKKYNWLKTKAAVLTRYPAGFYEHENTVTWRTPCNPYFITLHKFCYLEGKKTVTMQWLDSLQAIAIAVWFGDSGCFLGRGAKNACLRTQSFGLEGNKIIEQFFNEVGIPCKINKSKKSYVILFSVKGTEKLMALIERALPIDSKKC